VAAALGLTQVTVLRWFGRCGIQTATWTEAFLAPAPGARIKKNPN